MSAESRHHAYVLGRDGGCVLRQIIPGHECGPDANGRVKLEAAHVPPKSATKALRKKAIWRREQGEQLPPDLDALAELTEDELVGDGDLGITCCRAGHYAWDKRGVRCRRDRLPRHVERKCREIGLTRLLDELLPPAPGQPDLRPIPLRSVA